MTWFQFDMGHVFVSASISAWMDHPDHDEGHPKSVKKKPSTLNYFDGAGLAHRRERIAAPLGVKGTVQS